MHACNGKKHGAYNMCAALGIDRDVVAELKHAQSELNSVEVQTAVWGIASYLSRPQIEDTEQCGQELRKKLFEMYDSNINGDHEKEFMRAARPMLLSPPVFKERCAPVVGVIHLCRGRAPLSHGPSN